MEPDPDEQHKATQATDLRENPSSEAILPTAVENKIVINEPNMEVHHPHHPERKKKWNEYFLEFFMLFLAVFLGFLVENYREHKVDEQRLEKHMYNMIENLEYDSLRFHINLTGNLIICKGLDSFRFQINEAINGRVNANRLYYYYWKYGLDVYNPTINNSTITQLKSSGLLRMIKNDSLSREIGDYYERRFSALQASKDELYTKLNRLNLTYRQFFSFQGFDELLERDTVFIAGPDDFFERYYANIPNREPSLKLMTNKPTDFVQLYNDVADFELALRKYNSFIRYIHVGAESLSTRIKSEYEFN